MPEAETPVGPFRRRWRSRRYVVVDASMEPTLAPGDRLLADPVPLRDGLPSVGTIVVLRDPTDAGRLLVKRIAARDEASGRVTVLGDAAEASRDSRAFGDVPGSALVGVVWFRYLPRPRRGPVGTAAAPTGPKR